MDHWGFCLLSIEEIMMSAYGMNVTNVSKLQLGAASDTYVIETTTEKYILKHPCKNEINNPEVESMVCEFLLRKGILVSEFVKNKNSTYLTDIDGEIYHLQKYIEGINYDLHKAPEWLMDEAASNLGRIHSILEDYPRLSEGIGENFFSFMTPQRAMDSYHKTILVAENKGDLQTVEELRIRLEILERFPYQTINLHELSCGNTHGDYSINQWIAADNKMIGIIDWTSACVHPYVWEIIRSFVYAEPDCEEGEIPIEKLISYVKEYLKYHSLTKKDLEMMPIVFYYQIAVCDYYAQYYESNSDNREIFLNQARFSTKLMIWFHHNIDRLIEYLQYV